MLGSVAAKTASSKEQATVLLKGEALLGARNYAVKGSVGTEYD